MTIIIRMIIIFGIINHLSDVCIRCAHSYSMSLYLGDAMSNLAANCVLSIWLALAPAKVAVFLVVHFLYIVDINVEMFHPQS